MFCLRGHEVMSSIYRQCMQTSVTGLNKGRNAAGVCDKRLRKENAISVSHTHTNWTLTTRVILETAVREGGDTNMEIQIKLYMKPLFCLLSLGSAFSVRSLLIRPFSSAFSFASWQLWCQIRVCSAF